MVGPKCLVDQDFHADILMMQVAVMKFNAVEIKLRARCTSCHVENQDRPAKPLQSMVAILETPNENNTALFLKESVLSCNYIVCIVTTYFLIIYI